VEQLEGAAELEALAGADVCTARPGEDLDDAEAGAAGSTLQEPREGSASADLTPVWREDGYYVAEARKYAEAVLAGAVPACKWVKAACRRQLDDLERGAAGEWAYEFSTTRAEHVCRFIELLPHIKGRWAGSRIRLEPWQIFILTAVFGWLVRGTLYRRYRTVYIEVPRKNAKSTLSSAVALYMLTADREPGAEIYSAATTRDQARIIFNDAKQMAQRTPELRIRFGVRCYVHSVSSQFREQRESELAEYAGLFIPLSAEGSTLDGLNVHFATVDELHAHKKRAVWDVIETATGSRTQSLLWAITTAGVDTSGICYEQRSYVTRLLNAVLRRHDGLGYPIKGTFADDETYFGIVYTIDDGDDWSDPTCWSKANPNLGISVYPDDIRRLADKALRMASARSNFLTKRLNVWVNAAQAWMDMRKWDACADPELAIEQFLEDDAIIALDLASKRDIADKLTLFDRLVDGKKHYYAFARHYLPDEACSDDVNPQYVGWKTDGWLTTTPGNVTDYDAIERDLEADIARLKVREVPFDPWQATQLSTHMLEKGAPMIELRQTVQNLSEAMKEFEAVVIDGRFHHRGDPVLTWMVGNVIARRDAKDNIYPRKEHEDKKIDGAVACIMAIARAMVKAPPQASVYEELARERAAAEAAKAAEEAKA
jgi:phage terminase large subunit-like protein